MPQQPASQPSPLDPRSASRRRFLGATAVTAASGLVTPKAFGAVHSGGSEKLRIGLIGSGGRGKGAVSDAMNAGKDAVLVAMADAFSDNVEAAHKELSATFGERVQVPEERRFAGFDAYKQVIESDCDIVFLTTPPGFRPIHFKAAVDAGKHVFMEKPVAVDAVGIRQVMESARDAKDKGLAVGVGLQRRHDDLYNKMVERIWDGALGDEVLYTRVYWNGGGVWTRPRTSEQTEMEYQMRNWYYFNWICGDHIVEQHIHNLDVSNWIKRGHPVKANGIGGREVRTGKEHGQIFDHHAVEFTYADGSTMMSQCRHIEGCWSQVSEFAHGVNGHCNLGGGMFYDRSGKATERVRKQGENPYVQEHIDLQKSIKDSAPLAEGETGAVATMTAILGRLATYSGKIVEWDQAIESDISLAPSTYAFDADPPVLPDDQGRYPVPVPGVSNGWTA
ncbi:putative oxidoreductase YvaA [Botrimarina colliarenosi]|uniref:Putative oxidoreductase YvaA n=1 Tax=Botrimarina colliarenosi TaxID=2528001 RepID=A0A5C6AHF6_9BACT|nr:Gfo/Idh/MocA family oxidoreductase [Botrimarina colliarenosi]TWT99424.1 putative oxidoreductase YvaA [Botrimarina colliarenosi]